MRNAGDDKPKPKREKTRKINNQSSRNLVKLQAFSRVIQASGPPKTAIPDAADAVVEATPPRKATKTTDTGGQPKRATAGVALSRVLGDVTTANKFKCKDDSLREALYNYQDTPARTPEWAMKVVDAVYRAASALVRRRQHSFGCCCCCFYFSP